MTRADVGTGLDLFKGKLGVLVDVPPPRDHLRFYLVDEAGRVGERRARAVVHAHSSTAARAATAKAGEAM